jgi:hypothetical protein
MSLDDSMHSKSGISVFSNPFLLQIILLVAINYKNNTLAKTLADIGPPPPRCIFHFELCSLREYTPPHAINREVLAHLVRQGWAIPDQKAIIYAVQSPDASSGIELFRAIVGSGFDLSKNDYATSLPNLAAASGELQMLQHILSHFSIRRPNDNLILTAVKSRSSGGADMLRYLMNQGISVNYYKPGSSWASSPTDPYDGYGDPRARAEAEYAAGFSGYRKGFDTALHLAAQNGNVEAVRVLLDRGARKSMLDGAGRTPFQRAQQANREKVLDMLRE